MAITRVKTTKLPNPGDQHLVAQWVQVPDGAVLRDAFGDATGTVNLVYEANDGAPIQEIAVYLLSDGAPIPVGQGAHFLRTVIAAGSEPSLHVYWAPDGPVARREVPPR